MRRPDWTAERAELERVAGEYRARGYDVVVSPTAAELPDFAREYPPDIVARGEGDSVLVEVTNPSSKADRDRVRAIAESVEHQPGWRFVVVSPGQGGEPLPVEQFRSPDPAKIQRILASAEWLKSSGLHEAAVLMYWAGIEAAMRLAATRYGIELPRPDAWSLMRELVSNGVLHRDLYQQLNDAFRLRSAVAHGFEPASPADLEKSLAILRQTAQALTFDPEHPLLGPGRPTPETSS
jgi:uncharacterized protein YutE (UPF0331/DUF86 family)